MAGPLSGIRVLDLSRVLAGPWAGQILADMGAEVIKVERPGLGDDTRQWGPPFLGEGKDAPSAYFLSANRGKKSVAIDLATEEGADLVRRLAGESDIVIENFRRDGLKRYGLDYHTLKNANSALIYCSITGFGQTGPRADEPGYDFMIQGMGGLMSITGEPDGSPMKTGVAIADLTTGMYSVIAILGALQHRERTGEGQYIDMALFDTQLSWLANQAMNGLVTGKSPMRRGNAHPNIVPYQDFPTSDGHIIIAVGNDRQFERLLGVLEMEELIDDKRFATNRARVENRDILVPLLINVLKTGSSGEWGRKLNAARIPWGPINTVLEAFDDPQARARHMQFDLKDKAGRDVPQVASPIQYSATPLSYDKAPPALGEDTDAVLEALGLDKEELATLKDKGIIEQA